MKKLLVFFSIITTVTTIQGSDFDIYGNINLGVWYLSPERFYDDTSKVEQTSTEVPPGSGNWVTETFVTMGMKDTMDIIISNWIPFGTFGVNYKGNNFGGCIEMGTHPNAYDSKFYGSATTARFQRKISDYVTMQKWYAEWYINDVITFLFGKDFVPTNFFSSNQMFFGGVYRFGNVGCLSTGAYPMIQLKVKSTNDVLEGKIAVIKVDTTAIHIQGAGDVTNAKAQKYQCSVKIPKFEGRFGYTIGGEGIFSTHGNFAGGFQTYESVLFSEVNIPPLIKDSLYLRISSFIVGADLGVKVGPVSLTVDALFGQNIGVYGAFVGDRFKFWRYNKTDEGTAGQLQYNNEHMAYFYPSQNLDTATNKWILNNSQAYAVACILNITPVTWLSIEGGFGIVMGSHENEIFDANFDKTLAWYAQTEWTILEMLKITPEVGQYDYGPLKGYGRYLYWGLNTGIEF